jgi:glycosyltransferase involved in cell wall biosynthesis
MKKIFLSVVVPSFNEMKNLERDCLNSFFEYLNSVDFDYEVIFSDDGSTDQTTEYLKKIIQENKKCCLLENEHRGKGPTVIAGLKKAKGEWVLFTDFDQSTPLNQFESFRKFLDSNQVVIGSREIGQARREKEPLYRHLMGRCFNLLVQILAISGILDTQCGFKVFNNQVLAKILNKITIYGENKIRKDAYTGAFDVEMLYLTRKFKFKIKEVPILWKHYETDRVSPIKDSLRMLIDILRIKKADFLGKYND